MTVTSIPACKDCEQKKYVKQLEMQSGLADISKVISSKRQHFDSGINGLQAQHVCAIQSCLQMMVKNGGISWQPQELLQKVRALHLFMAANWCNCGWLVGVKPVSVDVPDEDLDKIADKIRKHR